MSKSTTPWDEVMAYFVPKILCPECLADRPILVRSQTDAGSGDTIQKRVCRRCQCRFKVVHEHQATFDVVAGFRQGDSESW